MRRLWQLWTLFTLACCCLLMRLASVMLVHPAVSAAATPAGGLRTAAAREQLHLRQTEDGRGHILYADGRVFDAGRHDVIAGHVGLPDRWPDAARSVAEEGRSGLEYRFDSVLKLGKPGFYGERRTGDVAAEYTRAGQPGVDVRTTIDAAWQAALSEAIGSQPGRRAAAVLLSVPSNQILAMSATGGSTFQNLAVTPEVPGSVFKLAVAAAALDAMQVTASTHFTCDGALHLAGARMQCWRRHGTINVVDAIAQSCDVSFAQMGVLMGRTGISHMADKMHLNATGLQTIRDLPVLPEAMPAHVFLRPGGDNGLLANTAIGQEDVKISPLQAALLASTVAQDGLYRDAQLVRDLERNRRTLSMLPTNGPRRAFSPYAARVIGQGMKDAVMTDSGTAAWVKEITSDCAVKTGTAELPNGHVNAWLVGYWPAKKPQFAFSIYVGDEPSDRAHSEVRRAFRRLYAQYRQFPPASVIN